MEATDRLEFAPPTAPGLVRSIALAILAHAVLLAALTWGVNWHRGELLTVEAELWSAVPEVAAPKAVEVPAEPEPEPAPPPPQVAPRVSDADIALEREKRRKEHEELERLEHEKLALQKKREQEKQAAEDKKKKDKLKEQQDAKVREKLRQENLKRMAGLAGANGAPNSTGTAQKSAGPSASYAGRIRARIKPNIVFTEDISGNPRAEVEVRTSPDGTIVGSKLIKSSGNSGWDEAVLRAIEKTEVLPRNEDGVVPSPMTIGFRPRD
jgi:colicin import membrane protein